MIREDISEKLTTEIKVVSVPVIPSYEYFVKVQDFEKVVLAIIFFSLVFSLFVLVL